MNISSIVVAIVISSAATTANAQCRVRKLAAEVDHRILRAEEGDTEPQSFGITNWWKYGGEKKVQINVFTSSCPADFDSYAEQQASCEAKGQRLCKLAELCPNRGYYEKPFDTAFARGFDAPAIVANSDSWVAYDTNDDTRRDNCNTVGTTIGGCPGNGWVQVGLRAGGKSLCNTHCEVANACPPWGNVDGGSYTPNSFICCGDP